MIMIIIIIIIILVIEVGQNNPLSLISGGMLGVFAIRIVMTIMIIIIILIETSDCKTWVINN